MTFSPFRHTLRPASAMLLLAAALSVAGCQRNSASLDSSDSMNTASTRPASFQATAELGRAWQSDPNNIGKGLAYAAGLESLGQTEQQLDVLNRLHSGNPGDGRVTVIYGKKLLQAGKPADALPILEAAAASPATDWRVFSALGSAYDQQGLYDKAQEAYGKALALQPNEISVLNNMGMSYALQGNLKQAEQTLRQAMLLPNAATQPRLRQNLALVVGLQGRFEEARKIASEDLPADQVEANLDYLKKMLAQPNTWQQLSGSQG
ncbi:MAG: tetratricopeptide repeat protein [Rhizobiales bacterium]|nr:tetratricopeptide repeat protein [Hyphomicrobiales bacterium]MBI3672101.1 tetratricopeptide repeat protein [Hyphomicrobiales bacterium]